MDIIDYCLLIEEDTKPEEFARILKGIKENLERAKEERNKKKKITKKIINLK